MKKLLLFLTFVGILCISNTFAQLAVGDIAFIGYNTDSGPTAGADHSFSFISLTDIPGNEIIYFTEEGWNDDSNIWAGTTEGHLRWTAPSSGLSCGTVVYITESGVDTFTITGGGSLSLDSGSGWNLLGGDQVLAYQATNAEPATTPSFIAGINGDDGGSNALDPVTLWNDSSVGPLGTAGSGLPAGLSNGINCVALFVTSLTEQDNAKYVGTLTGTSTFLLAEINDRSNWSFNNTTAYDITPTSYSPSVTCVAACAEPDIPTITSAPPTICDGGSALLSISGNLNDATQWSVYTGSCGGTLVATTTSSTVIVTPTPPSTTYYVRGEGGCVTPGSCGSITITTTPIEDASFSYDAAAYCVDGSDPTPTITGVSGGSFSSSGGLSINTNTGTIDVSASTPNTYTVQYKSPGFCYGTETVSVTIEALPTVTFTAPSDVCIDAGVQSGLGSGTATGGVYSGSGVTDDGNGMTYSFDPEVAGVGTHTITYTFTNGNGCSNSASDDVEVFALPTVTFTATSDVCIDAGVQSGLGSGSATGGVYSGSGVTDEGNGMTYSFDPSVAGVGTHTVTYTFTNANGCSNSASDAIEVFALPTVTFTAPSDVCIDAGVQSGLGSGTATGGVYSGSGVTDDGNGMTYSFDPAVSGVGTHTITYTFTNANGCINTASDTIEVFALPTVTFTAPSDVCIDAGEQSGLGSGTATGGVYSGSGVTDDGNGMTYSFDPSVAGVGIHTITYTFTNANGCSNSASDAIEVFALPTVTFTAPLDVCVDAGIQSGLGSGTATGGVYSGSGVTDDGNGMTYSFDPSVSGVGTHTITYTFTNANGCSNFASDAIEVFALPTVTFTAPSDLCVDAGIQSGLGSGTATGGVYSGSGVTDDGNGMTYSFDPSVSGVGTHTITYTFTNANGCSNFASDAIEVFALPTVTFTAPSDLCVDAGIQSGLGSGTATGGVYSGSGVTDDGNGMTYSFDPSVAGVGTHTITYTFTNANGCSNSASDAIEVFALPTVTFTAPSDVCIDAGVQSGLGSGTATGGVYSGSGVTDDGNGMTYSFDPAVAGVGTHTITYTFTNGNGCSNSASDTIEVFALPIVTFTAPSDVCIDAGVQSGLGSGTATGGVYSGSGVTDDGNGMTYSFDPELSGVGTHTITYTFTNANGCSNFASDAIEVFALPTVTFTAPSDVCIDAGVQSGLGSGTATGGLYSGSGVTDDGNGMTYSFDPSVAGVGTHTITYTFTNANGCTNTASDDVEVIEVDDTVSQVGVVLTANESGATYQWYECPNTLLTGETNQSYTPSVNGDYKVVITSGSCMVESICVTISSLDIETFESKPKFAMYPNPSNNNVNIKSPIGDTFEIVNLLGQTVKVFKVNANVEKTIYIGNLSDGLYLVKVLGDSNISAKKLIVRK